MIYLHILKYILLLIPVGFLWLAYKSKQQYRKLKSTGRIPDMDAANRNYILFIVAAAISLGGVLYFTQKFGW